MMMTIDCPHCGAMLVVPENAAGRKARCTTCQGKFTIPTREQLIEDTVQHMVLDELDQRRHENDYEDELTSSRAYRDPPPSVIEDNPSGHSTIAGVLASAHGSGDSQLGLLSGDAVGIGDDSHGSSISNLLLHDTGVGMMDAVVNAALGEESPIHTDAALRSERPERRYPQELCPSKPRPYLVVRDITVNGVLLAFETRWLNNDAFRASMPMRCVFTGAKGDAALAARPMVISNRLLNEADQPRSIEIRYEQTNLAGHSPQLLLASIGRLTGVMPSYDLPVLYYAGRDKPEAISCKVKVTLDGCEACEVLIPAGQVALEWLERVNGRCGPEFAHLHDDVSRLSNDAWSALPDKTRQRLETWCRFQRGERFVLYLNDADFTSKDAGLAGVVITDQRLIYHKYRHMQSIALNQDAVLHIRPEDRVVRLVLQSGGRLAKSGKVPRADMGRLVEALSKAPRLRLIMGQG